MTEKYGEAYKKAISQYYEAKTQEERRKLEELFPQLKNFPESDAPSRNTILAVWELGNEWKELDPSEREELTERQYIQKYWKDSDYYERILRERKENSPTPLELQTLFKVATSPKDAEANAGVLLELYLKLSNKI